MIHHGGNRGGGKKQAQLEHAKRRAYLRYGLRLTQDDMSRIVRSIQDGIAVPVVKQSHRITLFDVTVQETTIRVAYDRVRKSIATVLTTDMEGRFVA